MDKFCTNCGHANSSSDRICVECGTPLTAGPQQTPASQEAKKTWPFKTKLLVGAAIVLAASVIGLYTWGSKSASAETTVSNFFEALQNKDAAALKKYTVLSNGEELTQKEAAAFIDLYQGITPNELNTMATIEKNGKFVGIFDAHKVTLSTQQASFYFPHDGLSLNLDGEPIEASQNDDGEYVFSGIVPGNYEAEFEFDDGQTEFAHLFDLTVETQEDTAYAVSIEEELPIGTASFQVTVAEYSPTYPSKIVIGEQEYKVDEEGSTEEIGPFLLDGSMEVRAEVEFPWGTATSEPVAIDEEYITIDISKLDEKVEKEIIDQFMTFLEEDIKASGTRDASVYTSLAPGQVKTMSDTFDSWKSSEYFYKGALTKVNLDAESITPYPEGVNVNAEVITQGANYYQSEQPELETLKYEVRALLAYDADKKKWIVDNAEKDFFYSNPFNLEPIQTIDGSQKVYEVKGSSDAVKETDNETVTSDDQSIELEDFMYQYNSLSVMAINSGDFSDVSYMISEDGPKWQESADYIDSLYAKGITEEHLGTTLENVEKIDANRVKVTTVERFIIHGTEKSSEKEYRSVNILKSSEGSWVVEELVSTNEI